MDYSIFYSSKHVNLQDGSFPKYDLFLSGFDLCARTKTIFDEINSKEKIWLIFPQYKDIKETDYDSYNFYHNPSFEEDTYFENFCDSCNINPEMKLCIDITGFIRPHLIFLIKMFYTLGVKKIDFLYSEPNHYERGENTSFTGITGAVEPVKWCSSENNNPDSDNDLLIIATGYDDKLVQKILQDKLRVKTKYHLIGFPSLQLDMYQENILKLNQTKELVENNSYTEFAPAMDPFMTAQAIHDIVEKDQKYTNIYLCPISTKPHTLGIALYYLYNFKDKPITIVFPYSKKYNIKTAIGMKRIWRYTFEFPNI
jgi:hypothetical protein